MPTDSTPARSPNEQANPSTAIDLDAQAAEITLAGLAALVTPPRPTVAERVTGGAVSAFVAMVALGLGLAALSSALWLAATLLGSLGGAR